MPGRDLLTEDKQDVVLVNEQPPREFAGAPVVETVDVPNCPVCGCERSRFAASGYDYEYRSCRNIWRFVRCEDCGHVWLNPRPSDSALSTIYPPTYYAYHYEKAVHPIAKWGKERLDSGKLAGVLRYLNRPLSAALDIGCGTGRYLHRFEAAGAKRSSIHGIELSESVIQDLRTQGFQGHCARVEQCDAIAPGSLDLITMFHVIEHVDDPQAVARKAASWLKPGGVFAMETPNIDSWDANLFKQGLWGGYHIPRHWNLFTPQSLARLLTSAGLSVVATRFQTDHSFWMYSFHHALRYGNPPRPYWASWFDPLRNVAPLAGFTAFDKIRGALGWKTSAMLVIAKKA